LQMGRAPSMVPSGSGYSDPPRRQVTATVAGFPGTMLTWRTEQRRMRPDRGIGRRSPPPSIGFSAIGVRPRCTAARAASRSGYPPARPGNNGAFVPSPSCRP
jgi:hypothetical protein